MRLWKILVFGSMICAPIVPLAAQDDEEYPIPEFTDEFLEDREALAAGKEVWESTCRACHGASAYPGKAPKLQPSRYDAEFVYDRVTYGFRKMPAWEDVLSEEERMSVSAYVVSQRFSP
jgi:cytochrome c oxidase cbb3-type subunit III